MSSKISVSSKDAKKFIKWIALFAFDAKYETLRHTLKAESVPRDGHTREKSDSMLEQLHTQFPSMTNCQTDVSCLKILFNAALNLKSTTEDDLKNIMFAMNSVLPLQNPTESQQGYYSNLVTDLRKLIRKSPFGDEGLKRHYRSLLFAGGSTDRKVAKQFKERKDDKARNSLDAHQKNKSPIFEHEILAAIQSTIELKTKVDALIFTALMTAARKGELVDERVANFDVEDSKQTGYIIQFGVLKDRDNYDQPTKRRVEKVIMRAIDKDGKPVTVKFVQDAILKLREMWGANEMIEKGLTNKQMNSKHDREIEVRIRELFPTSCLHADKFRRKALGLHFLRKVYINYTYYKLCDTEKWTIASWAVQNIGWKPSSGYATSNSYTDIQITMIPDALPEISRAEFAIAALIKSCKSAIEKKEAEYAEGSDDDSLALLPRVNHRRKLKRKFVDIVNKSTGETVRVEFHRRKKQSRDALIASVRDMIQKIKDSGEERVDATLIRAFGVGATTAKIALQSD